jgi:hypothetical protein
MASFSHRRFKGAGAMNIVVDDLKDDSPDDIILVEVRLHLSAASGVESFIVSIDSNAGVEHDSVLETQAMNGLTDDQFIDWTIIDPADHVVFTYPNATGVIWGLEMIYCRAAEIY